ncbi:MAG: hypothetical protein C5B58_00555 [Acidobacteria bacterium]|nr:MAG: hypothetical protein C5B58_00555 [Acidobacteriota bacterium]
MQRKVCVLFACFTIVALCASVFGQDVRTSAGKLTVRYIEPMTHGDQASRTQAIQSSAATDLLPVWNFQTLSSRDGNIYAGSMVGANPTIRGPEASVSVAGQIVPIILKLHTIGTKVNPTTGVITTVRGDTTFDPTVPDNVCLSAPHNVPVKLLLQSPILSAAKFNFGGTEVGTTQATDAFQRANFWKLIDKANYHVLLAPRVLAPLVIDVPPNHGLALSGKLFGACSSLGIVDINLVDAAVVQATLTRPGIDPKTFPMFMFYNSGFSFGSPFNLHNCCAGGYHGVNPTSPVTFQTYAPFDFQTNGIFRNANDTVILSHEAAEWMNDPYDINPTPAWGHTGQVTGCQNNLEVGDPLTGINAPPIVGSNGYTYHLQELAFYSWFYGAPSIGIHGWFSDNGTFLTDAGPPCM